MLVNSLHLFFAILHYFWKCLAGLFKQCLFLLGFQLHRYKTIWNNFTALLFFTLFNTSSNTLFCIISWGFSTLILYPSSLQLYPSKSSDISPTLLILLSTIFLFYIVWFLQCTFLICVGMLGIHLIPHSLVVVSGASSLHSCPKSL